MPELHNQYRCRGLSRFVSNLTKDEYRDIAPRYQAGPAVETGETEIVYLADYENYYCEGLAEDIVKSCQEVGGRAAPKASPPMATSPASLGPTRTPATAPASRQSANCAIGTNFPTGKSANSPAFARLLPIPSG